MTLTPNKLAVLIGSQARGLKDTFRSVNFFLEMLDVPYDIYVCSDREDIQNFNVLNNVRDTISLETVESENKFLLKSKERMHKHYWQNAKLYGVSMLFKQHKDEYTHALKMRTDFMFDYYGFFNDFGIDISSGSMTTCHRNYIRDHVRTCMHHCDFKQSRAFRDLLVDNPEQKKVMPLMWQGDRFWFGSADHIWRYSQQTMIVASKIKKIYQQYVPIPLHADFKVVHKQLSTVALPRVVFPNGLPGDSVEIAERMNDSREILRGMKELPIDESIEPLVKGGVPYAGHDVFCNDKFNADILGFVTQLYVPYIKPMKYGFIKHMHFTRYENNVKTTDQPLKIMQAFHDNDNTYTKNINIENKLRKC